MGQQDSEFIFMEDDNSKFSDALEEFPFFDASESFDFEHSLPLSNSSSLSELHKHDHDTISKEPKNKPESQSLPSSPGLRRRRIFSKQSSKELPWSRSKSNHDGSVEFDGRGTTISHGKNYKKHLWKLKDNEKLNDKLNRIKVPVSSGSVGKVLTEDSNTNSLISSVTTTGTSDESVSDRSVSMDSMNSSSNFLFILAGLMIKAIAFQTTMLVTFVTFPLWLTYTSYMFLTNPFAIVRRAKRCMKRRISRALEICYCNVKWIVSLWIRRNKSTFKFCLQIGWGLLWAVFVGLVLVGLLVFAVVISGTIMKFIMEEPVRKIEQLNFDYTQHTPMAYVPIMSCPEPFCLECGEQFKYGNTAQSRVIPLHHKLQATVSLTMPESDYNRNLGIFQVRVDFLSHNGKPLRSTMQPTMLQFRSQPIRLLMMFFKLAPLITGYSSESQTLNIKFSGYTESQVPTSCLRVVLEPRAEFARKGGVPELYTAYLKVESQLPFFKRLLWSWKATLFVWTSIFMFTFGLLFMMLCCTPVIVPRLRQRVPSYNNNNNNNASRR